MLFKLPAQQLMEVTHHQCPKQFKHYVVDRAWHDPEAASHAGRTFSLWAQDLYQPPVTTSIPDALGRIHSSTREAFTNISNSQSSISSDRDDPW